MQVCRGFHGCTWSVVQLSRSVADLESLVGLCLTIVDGGEPSSSLLLGVASDSGGGEDSVS